MPKLFALADLHLSLCGAKPMDVFGEHWKNHADRMAEAWDRRVSSEDTVLLPGDLSWAMSLEEAFPDLAWIGDRPGKKILLRGNHDYWWSSLSKVRAALPDGCRPLQNEAVRLGDWVLLGARGWIAPEDPEASPEDAKVFRRELERLRLSIADADRRFGTAPPRLAMLHYPPWLEGREPTEVVPLLRQAGVRECVYGHLHGEDLRLGVSGDREGIRFHLVSADAVGFAPALILPETGDSQTGGMPGEAP
jgi:predicted phosphohydrolase